ncbi:MAG: hypothetical protein QM790_20205 [Nibricoccus sp.]
MSSIVTLPDRFTPAFWSDADGRVALVKEIKRRVDTLQDHAGADSYQKKLLCQRAAFIAIQLETLERAAAEGSGIDVGVYSQLNNTLLGLLKALGLEKQAKAVGGLKTYLEGKRK